MWLFLLRRQLLPTTLPKRLPTTPRASQAKPSQSKPSQAQTSKTSRMLEVPSRMYIRDGANIRAYDAVCKGPNIPHKGTNRPHSGASRSIVQSASQASDVGLPGRAKHPRHLGCWAQGSSKAWLGLAWLGLACPWRRRQPFRQRRRQQLPPQQEQPQAPPSAALVVVLACLLYTSPSPRDLSTSRMPSSA